ncbi:MAG TPA: type IV pilus biogenesis/stability protein PilW [Rhodanobacter sp.]
MRCERLLILILALSMAGCVTTHTNSSSLGKSMPQTSKADRAVDAARIHTELGQRYMANGDLQTALEKLNLALKFDPNYAPAHTVIAVLYERINQPANAELHYRKAVALEPAKGAPNNNLGQFLCATGKYAEAAGYFQKAVADPFYKTPDVALTNAGVCHLEAKDAVAAEADFRAALTRNPRNAEALFQLANSLYLSNNAFGARAFLQRLEALGALNARALKLGHDIESRLGNQDGASTYAKQLHAQFPDSEQSHALEHTASP